MKASIKGAVTGGLLLLAFLAYSNSFTSGFVGDNKGLILLDPRVQLATADNVRQIFAHSYWWPIGEAGIHRPLTKLTYLFNYAVLGNGESPAGYHVVNLLLHLGNAWLVWLLGRRLWEDWRPAAALAALWLAHPVQTEAVTNIVGRADLLAAMSVTGGLLLYLKFAAGMRWPWLTALFLTALAGMFAKESAATVAGVIVLYELLWERRWKPLGWGVAVTLAALAIMWAQRSAVMTAAGHTEFPYTDNPIVGADWLTGRLTAVQVLTRSVGLVVWPARLSADYSYRQIPLATGSWADWLAVALLCAAVVALWRWNRTAAFLSGFALITYLPSSNLLFPIGSVMAERFLYLPSIGLLGLVVAAAVRWRWWPVAAGLLVMCLGARTWIRNQDWQTDLSLAEATVAASPESFKAHAALGLALFGVDGGRSRLEEAIAAYEKSVAILDPLPDAANNPETYMEAAGLMLAKGDWLTGDGEPTEEARGWYRKASALLRRGDAMVQLAAKTQGPPARFARLYRLLAAAQLRLGEAERSVGTARYARTLAPLDAEMSRQLAMSYAGAGDGERAAVALLSGVMLTSNASLRDDVVGLYRSGLDTEGCAARGSQLNAQCPLVHRHMCAAAADAMDLLESTGRKVDAARVRQMARGQMGCAGVR